MNSRLPIENWKRKWDENATMPIQKNFAADAIFKRNKITRKLLDLEEEVEGHLLNCLF